MRLTLLAGVGLIVCGSNDGGVRGYSTKDGSLVWEYDPNRTFDTRQRRARNGASINGPGPIVSANGVHQFRLGALGGDRGQCPPRVGLP